MELEDSLMCSNQEGKVFIPIRNATADALRVLPGKLIGSVDHIEVEEDAVVEGAPTSHGEKDKVYVATIVSQVEDGAGETHQSSDERQGPGW